MKYSKITLLAILSLMTCIFEVSAQKAEGDIERKAENYQKAISYYRNANFSSNIALRLAQCYAMIEQTDSAFYYLDFVIEREKENTPVSSYEGIKEFESLKKNRKWEKLMKKCIQFQNAYEAKLNIPLQDSIIEMRKIDISYQEKYDSIMLTNDSISIKSFIKEWEAAVKKNDLRLTKIIDNYGWPTKELVGNNASEATFFMVQHSLDLKLQEKCLALFKQIEVNDINHLIQIAYLEDRILVKSGEKQLYGTQYKNDKLHTIDDPDNLNQRRAQIGLAPIQFVSAYSSQNLIPNYSFELYSGTEYPKYLRDIDGGWEKVGGESWSKLNDDDKELYSRNFMHIYINQPYFNSYSGNAYIIYWTVDFGSNLDPELFQVELKDSLITGEEYLIEYYVRSKAKNKQTVTQKNDVCVFLLRYKYNYKITSCSPDGKLSIKESFKMTPDIFFYENKPVEDFSEWTKVSAKYVAKGGEKYFLIGHYGEGTNDCKINLDNITMQKITGNKINIENAKVGEAIVLENISFELNSSKLTNSSYSTLNQVVKLFNAYTNLVVEIAGHTDNIGDKNANLKLSENRAKSVINYLISAGVETKKVQAKGYGESFPISDNTTKKGREKNRRVEFKILQR
jgi:outer membrane protein OmpA-like peptidoglycan-associated protein